KAVDYLEQAGEKASVRGARSEAITYYEQALDALSHLRESRATVERGIDFRLALRWELFSARRYQQALKVLREAEDLARGLDDQRRLGWVIAYQAHMYMSSGVPDRAVELGERARAIGEALGDSALQAQANMYAGGALRDQGSYGRAIDCLRWSLAQLRAK